MRIAYITAGAAGMYCGSCIHDNTLARALIAQGHDVALMPLYTPIRTDEEDVSMDKVFYGAINVYLEQRSPLFRKLPGWMRRLLSGRRLLNWAARQGQSSVDARDLGALTLSTLQGEDGNQASELESVVQWLRDDYQPDLVHLSNSMLVGLAPRIREALQVPVFCSLQGEDIFLDDLVEPYKTQIFREIRKRSSALDAYVSTSHYYVDFMRDYLGVADTPIEAVPLGIDLADLEPRTEGDSSSVVIGFLARACPEKGLHLLLEAFERIANRPGLEHVRLRIAGYQGERDREYIADIKRRIAESGLAPRIEMIGEIDRASKRDFLHSIDILSVPTTYKEPKGLFVLEAMACGVAVVQPDHGTFPELIRGTGGGILTAPNDAVELAAGLERLCRDPELRRQLGQAGRQGVEREFSAAAMATRTLQLYQSYLAGKATAPLQPTAATR